MVSRTEESNPWELKFSFDTFSKLKASFVLSRSLCRLWWNLYSPLLEFVPWRQRVINRDRTNKPPWKKCWWSEEEGRQTLACMNDGIFVRSLWTEEREREKGRETKWGKEIKRPTPTRVVLALSTIVRAGRVIATKKGWVRARNPS